MVRVQLIRSGEWYLEDGEGDELIELLGELVPELALVEIRHGGVPLRKLGLRGPLRLQVLQRRHGHAPTARDQTFFLQQEDRRGEEGQSLLA